MRIGAVVTEAEDVEDAASAGLFAILWEPAGPTETAEPATGIAAAAEVAARTLDARVLVRVVLGSEHPVTLAEEVAVLDHLSAGRAVAVIDPGELTDEAAMEDLALLRACWSGRPVRHAGKRWTVPSGVMGDVAPAAGLAVTPVPAQIDVPVWLLRPIGEVALPVVARDPAAVRTDVQVQPATAELTGELEQDRALVTRWAEAGTTHLLVRPPSGPAGRAAAGAEPGRFFARYVARYLQPEVSMPAYPRIMSEAALPATWTA
ncbi:LLM class flavin-dependent oxidoreductase [Streptomyces sp. NPDC093109]|uniref:LLM class flavin-dependent oxidoreductase n=1 Tax=Streptomyces sp. NPDC093109 TaxID=3154977 RepID=UPI00344F87F3